MRRGGEWAWFLAPVLLMLGLYWLGLQTWFYQDDFGWLRVRLEIHGWRDVLPALFFPKAHGNLRPLSETGFFTLFSAVFGVEPLPFRIWVFLTQAASLWLLGDLIWRWTRSRWAALAAQGVWLAQSRPGPVMCWTSVYNQVLCGFLLLLALRCLARHLETGERRWWRAQWVAFVLGLGALETAVVYPALARSTRQSFGGGLRRCSPCRRGMRSCTSSWRPGAAVSTRCTWTVLCRPHCGATGTWRSTSAGGWWPC